MTDQQNGKTKPMIDKSRYIDFSGNALGSDKAWDNIGRKYGFNNHLHFKPEDFERADYHTQRMIVDAVNNAAKELCRPNDFEGILLVYRNWFQVSPSEGIFAIGYIHNPGKTYFGQKNNSGKQVVAGGTGWTIEMAIQMKKPVYIFDQNDNAWYYWDYSQQQFLKFFGNLILTEKYTGIGTRKLTRLGTEAIENIYINTQHDTR